MNHATVAPRKIKLRSELMQADMLSTVGYVASCPCGYFGKTRTNWRDARVDAYAHNHAKHPC